MKKLNILLLSLLLVFVCQEMSFAQFLSGKNAQVLLKGMITDETTNEALAVSIEFRSKDGKKIKTQSNENGHFEYLLPSGDEYLVILNSDDILRKEFNFKIDESDKYKEQTTEWTAIKTIAGARIFNENIFDNSSASISKEGSEALNKLQMLLRFNRTLNVDFFINGDSNLSQNRIDEISKLVSSWTREKSRITISKGNPKPNSKELEVYINKISDYLK